MEKLLRLLLKIPDDPQLFIERVYSIPHHRQNRSAEKMSSKIWIVQFLRTSLRNHILSIARQLGQLEWQQSCIMIFPDLPP